MAVEKVDVVKLKSIKSGVGAFDQVFAGETTVIYWVVTVCTTLECISALES